MTRPRPSSTTLVGVLVAVLGAALATSLLTGAHRDPVTHAQVRDRVRSDPVAGHALAVLHGWDERRAAAYRRGSGPALRRLYAPGSGAGLRDVRTLRRYAERGLVVTGMRMQVLAVEVLRHGPRRLRVLVTDRLTGAVAVSATGRWPLPQDRPSRRELTLVRQGGTWRVLAVRPVFR